MTKSIYAHVDEHGRLLVPQNLIEEWGIKPGDRLLVDDGEHGFQLRAPVTTLRKVYIELTNQCNLSCSTCMRNVWDVKSGYMSNEIFGTILSGLVDLSPRPEIFIGGYGEPLFHPHCLNYVEQAKSLGFRVSIITNGILLTKEVSDRLIDARLDRIWVSLDGASPDCYTNVRLGNALPVILENLETLRKLQYAKFGYAPWMFTPSLGIAFVAMRRNIQDLPEVLKIGRKFWAVEYSISNVLAHNEELHDELLYNNTMYQVSGRLLRRWNTWVHFPRLDIDKITSEVISNILKGKYRLDLFGGELDQAGDRCPFVERGSLAMRWDGKVSPCLPLMYTHTHYLDDRLRTSKEYFVGDMTQNSITDIWMTPAYLELREQIEDFDFSPCLTCNSCEMADENVDDCFGNVHPTCGGCLWAQGLIRCP